MRIGVPKEIKVHEYRVGLTPASVREAVAHGHEVFVEHNAPRGRALDGITSGPAPRSWPRRPTCSPRADLIVKVKEPQPAECAMLRAGPDALHLPAPRPRPRADPGADAVRRDGHRLRDGDQRARRPAAAGADERGRRPHGHAGRRALPGEGAGRTGMLLGGVPGVAPANVVDPRRRRVGRQRGAHGDRARART